MADYRMWTRKLESMESTVIQGDYKQFLKYFKLYLYGKYAKKDNLDMGDVTIHLNRYKELLKKKNDELKLYSKKCSNSIIALKDAIDYSKDAIALSQDTGYAQVEKLATKKIGEVNSIKKGIDEYSTTLENAVTIANKMIVLLGQTIDDGSIQKIMNGVRVLDSVSDFNTKIIEYKSQYDNLLKNYTENRVKIGDLPKKYSIVLDKLYNWLMFKLSTRKKIAFGVFLAILSLTIANPASTNAVASSNAVASTNAVASSNAVASTNAVASSNAVASTNAVASSNANARAVVVNNTESSIHKDDTLNILSYGGKNYKIKGKLSGVATTYGAKFEGRKTKSGETFSHKRLSCAVPIGSSLFGKLLLITSRETGRSIIVRANDVGNFGYDDNGKPNKYSTYGNTGKERIVDLPQRAWVFLGVLDKNKLDSKADISLSDFVDVSVLEEYD